METSKLIQWIDKRIAENEKKRKQYIFLKNPYSFIAVGGQITALKQVRNYIVTHEGNL